MKKNKIILLILILLDILIIINSKIITENIRNTINIFLKIIIPSIIPTMIIGNLLINLNFVLIIPKFIKKIFNKLFNFDDNMTSIFIMSLICGSPTNSIIIKDYYNKKLIDEKTSINMLYITQFINPLFIISISKQILNNNIIPYIILILLIISILIKTYLNKNNFNPLYKNINIYETKSIIKELNNSITKTIKASSIILCIIIIFNTLTSLITLIFNLNTFTSFLINSILEITGGLIKLKYLNINILYKSILIYLLISFGSLSIHMQNITIFNNKKIRYIKYLINRLMI